jgi:RNA polymerase sigma factor (sigma-70 family)
MNMPFDAMLDVSNEALLVAYGNGDRHAARALTIRLTPIAFRLASRLLQDTAEAEDVAQEAMMRLWKIAPDWRQGEARVTTWLYRVVVNLCTDRRRKKQTVALDQIAEPADGAPSVRENMMNATRNSALQQALDTLPARQKEAVILRHIEGISNPEIASVMDISVEAVESLTSRGKRALTAVLARRHNELGYEDD